MCAFLCAPLGLWWKMAKQCWALWWAAGPPGPCWLDPSSSPCTTVPCVTANRIGWSSSRTIHSRTSGRWDVGGTMNDYNVCHRGQVRKKCLWNKIDIAANYPSCIWLVENYSQLKTEGGKGVKNKMMKRHGMIDSMEEMKEINFFLLCLCSSALKAKPCCNQVLK